MFGCATYAKKFDNTTFKLKAKNNNCVFMGYNLDYKTYKFIEEST